MPACQSWFLGRAVACSPEGEGRAEHSRALHEYFQWDSTALKNSQWGGILCGYKEDS